ncbi:MAG TPA: PAS domain S-box protein [Longimicrobiales bacterium]
MKRPLSRTEELFRLVSENVADHSIILLDADGTVVSWTEGARKIDGYAPEEILGKNVAVFSTPEAIADGEPQRVLEAAARDGNIEVEGWRVRSDGSRYWANEVLTASRDERGRLTGFVRIARDMSERRRLAEAQRGAEERLKEREHFFRSIIERSSDILIVLDESALVRYVSPSYETITGHSTEDLLGTSGMRFMDDESAALIREMMIALIERGEESASAIVRSVDASGELHVYDTRARNLLGDPLFHGIVVDARDITEREHIVAALRASEERFRKIVETAGEGIGIRDVSGQLSFANERFAQMLGYTLDEVIGRNVFDLVAPEHRRLMAESAERRRLSGRSEQLDIEFLRKDGSHVCVILHASPLFDGNGNYVGALGMLTDITERKQLEEQLRQAQKIEAVGRLAGGIAHDFNNLLTAIRGHVELLLAEVAHDTPIYSDVEEIRKAAERAAALTHQLLAFSRRQILQPSIIEVDQIVRDMETLFRRLIGEDIRLATHLRSGARIRADRGQIEQVLMNLAVNARDAMPNGGSLTIETRLFTIDEEFMRAHEGSRPGPNVQLLVKDTGFGMDPDTLSHVFEPFFTTKELGKGTGLGLATVYGIIKQSGGYITVESGPETGTSFSILLPVVNESASAPRAPTAQTGVSANGETVLVAEDEDAVRALASRILRKRGYHVLEARHGAEALEIAERHDGEIHLLLTDVVMPALGGRELGERLRRLRPRVKVLFMSGYTDDALLQRGMLQGSSSFLEKPFTPDGLARKVREVLESY